LEFNLAGRRTKKHGSEPTILVKCGRKKNRVGIQGKGDQEKGEFAGCIRKKKLGSRGRDRNGVGDQTVVRQGKGEIRIIGRTVELYTLILRARKSKISQAPSEREGERTKRGGVLRNVHPHCPEKLNFKTEMEREKNDWVKRRLGEGNRERVGGELVVSLRGTWETGRKKN